MGGFAFYDDVNRTVDVPKSETLVYIMTYFPDIITNTREETILDRAESSTLDKFVLIVQVAWFCISCGSRLLQRLPLTLLEVSTAAHAFCTLATYVVWWSKPLNVAEPTILREKEAQEVYALLKCLDSEYLMALEMARGAPQGPQPSERVVLAANALGRILKAGRPAPTPEKPTPENPAPENPALTRPPEPRFREPRRLIPGNFSNKPSKRELFVSLAAAISPILYGPIHFLAWNDHFPTPMERLLWRVSSIVVTCSGLVGVCVAYFVRSGSDGPGIILSFVVIPAMHILASGYLIVASFLQLASLDSAAYRLPSWSYYWPHFS